MKLRLSSELMSDLVSHSKQVRKSPAALIVEAVGLFLKEEGALRNAEEDATTKRS